jgi:hypothetical protein
MRKKSHMDKPANRKNSYSRKELELCGKGVLFGLDTGRLPTGNMLMFDRIVEINDDDGANGKGQIKAPDARARAEHWAPAR